MVFFCGTCWRCFPTGWKARDQHCDATGHEPPEFECDTCDRWFGDEIRRQDHMTRHRHWDPDAVECRCCTQMCADESDRSRHELRTHLYCYDCDRWFQNYNNVKQHLNSWKHRSSDVACPFCGLSSGTATGLVHHLERGACPRAPLNREKLYRVVRRYDPQGTISKKLIGYTGDVSYEATARAWNPEVEAYECYLCHNLFGSLHGLNQHLASPRHQQALYHCPNTGCRKDFTTLAALINHLESESCGFMRFQGVQTGVHQFVNPSRRIGF